MNEQKARELFEDVRKLHSPDRPTVTSELAQSELQAQSARCSVAVGSAGSILDALDAAIRPLWEKARAARRDCFCSCEGNPKDTEARNGYYWNEGAEHSYRDALNFIARARLLLPNDKAQPRPESGH